MEIYLVNDSNADSFEKKLNKALSELHSQEKEIVDIKYSTAQIPQNAMDVFYSALILYK